jgi:membrane-associated PAP2 superfamily phosphatase
MVVREECPKAAIVCLLFHFALGEIFGCS